MVFLTCQYGFGIIGKNNQKGRAAFVENDLHTRLVNAMEALDEDTVLACAGQLLEQGCDKYTLFRLLDQGSSRVGYKFEQGEYFLADLIVAGGIYSNVLSAFHFCQTDRSDNYIGTVLIGVVRSDIHDIGKDIIVSLLRTEGFRVIDLGVDVEPEKFVAAALQYKPLVVAMSGVLAYSVIEMGNTIQALRRAGVGDFASLLIGGVVTDESSRAATGADAFARAPMETLNYCLSKVK